MKRKPTNSIIAAGVATTELNADSWNAFDDLPRAVREVLWGAPVSINPLTIAPLVDDGIEYALTTTTGAIRQETALFDRQHKAKHGYALPAVASGVATLRYGDALKPTVNRARRRREIIRRKGRKT
jgi:hypothetical protein